MPRSSKSVDEYHAMAMLLDYDWYDPADHTFNKFTDQRQLNMVMMDPDTLKTLPWVNMHERRQQVFRKELGAIDYDAEAGLQQENLDFREM